MKALRRCQTSSSEKSSPQSSSPNSSSLPWIHLRSVLFLVASSSPANCSTASPSNRYDLTSSKEERDAIRTRKREEYENLRRICRRLRKHYNEDFNLNGSEENSNGDGGSPTDGMDSRSSEDVVKEYKGSPARSRSRSFSRSRSPKRKRSKSLEKSASRSTSASPVKPSRLKSQSRSRSRTASPRQARSGST